MVTIGSIVSNHCRTTALSARRLGLKPHVIVRSPTTVSETSLKYMIKVGKLWYIMRKEIKRMRKMILLILTRHFGPYGLNPPTLQCRDKRISHNL